MTEEVVDSSVLVAFWLKEDKFHNEAVKIMEGLRTGEKRFHIPALVAVEVCGAIGRRLGEKEARKVGEWLQGWINLESIKVYPLDEKRMGEAINKAIAHRLKGADAVVVELSQELELSLRSFDEEVKRTSLEKETSASSSP